MSLSPHLREIIRFNDELGWRERIRSIDYFRCLEYPLALELCSFSGEERTLDIGVGTGPFSLFLAARRRARLAAVDLVPEALHWQRSMADRLGLGPERFATVQADARQLPFTDRAFDRILALGSLEHVDGNGDSTAMAELGRLLAPGGRVVMTVPYGPVFEEIKAGPHVAYPEKRYDDDAVTRRLVEPSGLIERERGHFGEPGHAASRYWYRLPFVMRLPWRRAVPLLSGRFLRRLHPHARRRACGAWLVLEAKS